MHVFTRIKLDYVYYSRSRAQCATLLVFTSVNVNKHNSVNSNFT